MVCLKTICSSVRYLECLIFCTGCVLAGGVGVRILHPSILTQSNLHLAQAIVLDRDHARRPPRHALQAAAGGGCNSPESSY
jgi:hypothetical protein